MKLLKELLEFRELYKELINLIYVFINLDCEIHGTCKDCLEDGRGTHTEQLETVLEKLK